MLLLQKNQTMPLSHTARISIVEESKGKPCILHEEIAKIEN